jgi:hypothetical protein
MFSNLHIYKTNSILQAAATGVDPSDIEVFVEHHKGHDPTNLDQLSTPSATSALVICFHFFVGLMCGSSILILNGLLVTGGLWPRNGSSIWRCL